jgi:conjugative relaxase-like TrwC/TraI family protein
MLTISKPLAAGQALRYHREEFSNAETNYFTEDNRIRGEWQGRLAKEWGLTGEVQEEQFARLSQGQHPHTGEQLISHRRSYTYQLENGEQVQTMEHRAGWDFTFSAPKSVSITGLVGGDRRIVEAHKESVTVALDAVEEYTQARMGGHYIPETTARWVVAKFHHDTARPDQREQYVAPQLHTHSVVFNMTRREDGSFRALDAMELFRSQQFGSAVYQAELGRRLRELGYEVHVGKNGAPEITGYSREYLDANSLRSTEIRAYLSERGLEGAGAAQIAAHRTREAKNVRPSGDIRQLWEERAAEFGNEHQRVIHLARERGPMILSQDEREQAADRGLTYARDRNFEREAVVDERSLLRDTLRRGIGSTDLSAARQAFAERTVQGEFVEVAREHSWSPARRYTTPEMLRLEQQNIDTIAKERDRFAHLVPESIQRSVAGDHLNDSQRRAVEVIFSNRDRVVGLQGDAGAGKTTTLAVIREGAEKAGYEVRGLAPTSRAAKQLAEAGLVSETLQKHLAAGRPDADRKPALYVIDESSLASTRQVNTFLHRLREGDRVLLVGDARQHEGVEAGRPFAQAQQRGMQSARLDTIVRQKDEGLRQAVRSLANRDVHEAIDLLAGQGRVKEIVDPLQRMEAIADEYRIDPGSTLVVSPDNASRQALNNMIRASLQEDGWVDKVGVQVRVLIPRQDLTGADRQWASRYEAGDAIRFSKGSKEVGIRAGEYASVLSKDAQANTLTVKTDKGVEITYDPRRLHGVAVYQPQVRELAKGDRVQFTSPVPELRIANREQGTVRMIDSAGIQVRLDSGRRVVLDTSTSRHVDYGYAVTSYSSQGLTARRVLIHADTTQSKQLVNERYAYVAVSRGSHDARVYTDNAHRLSRVLGREHSKTAAVDELSRQVRQEQAVPAYAGRERTV